MLIDGRTVHRPGSIILTIEFLRSDHHQGSNVYTLMFTTFGMHNQYLVSARKRAPDVRRGSDRSRCHHRRTIPTIRSKFPPTTRDNNASSVCLSANDRRRSPLEARTYTPLLSSCSTHYGYYPCLSLYVPIF